MDRGWLRARTSTARPPRRRLAADESLILSGATETLAKLRDER